MKNLPIFICLISVSVATPCYSNPVLVWVGQYLLGKAVDGVWSAATGAPDIGKLDSRLKEVETLLDGSLRQPIASLRSRITSDITRAQYEVYVRTAISSLEQQIAKNSDDIQSLQRRVTALENNQRGLPGDLKRYLGSGSNLVPPPREYPLRSDGGRLNLYVNGRPTVIWSDGYVDVWADQNPLHFVLNPGHRMNFTRNGTIHAVSRSSGATKLFSQPIVK